LRTARALLLIFLALLMPVRAAVAGAMLCPTGGTSVSHPQHPQMYDDSTAGHAHHEGMHHDAAQPSPASHAHDGGCNLCASFCSMTPMPSSAPTIEPALLAATLSFPALRAPAPSFQSDGPDRPPRSR
jgi:hypothetical protein